jgi:hypothetical protein
VHEPEPVRCLADLEQLGAQLLPDHEHAWVAAPVGEMLPLGLPGQDGLTADLRGRRLPDG